MDGLCTLYMEGVDKVGGVSRDFLTEGKKSLNIPTTKLDS